MLKNVCLDKLIHLIIIGYSCDLIESYIKNNLKYCFYLIDGKLSLIELKELLIEYQKRGNVNEIYLVNASLLSRAAFDCFLKFLEDERFLGVFWFYGVPIEIYPLTFQSRCRVIVNLERSLMTDIYLKTQNASEYLEDMQSLLHFTPEFAYSLLKVKNDFISFLLGLQFFTLKDFGLLSIYEKMSKEFFWLYQEWCNQSIIFKDKELSYCPSLKDKKLVKQIQTSAKYDFMFERYFVMYLISHVGFIREV